MTLHMEERRLVAKEAVSWINTPYVHSGAIKGVGVDCAYLMIETFKVVGVDPPTKVPDYKPGLAGLREGQILYEKIVRHYANEVPERGPKGTTVPLPGDVILFRFVHLTHGAIVLRWPYIIHAYCSEGKVTVSDASVGILRTRWERTYALKKWCGDA